jgi:putative flippase GtrA
VVGSLGFVVDAGLLAGLLGLGFGPFSARAISLAAAVFTTWRLNRVVFGAADTGQLRELGRYLAVVAVSSGVNAAIYALALLLMPALTPLAALAIGSAAAFAVSFGGYDRFAFRRTSAGSETAAARRGPS